MGVVTFWFEGVATWYEIGLWSNVCISDQWFVVIVFKQIMILFVAKSIEMQNDNHLFRGKTWNIQTYCQDYRTSINNNNNNMLHLETTEYTQLTIKFFFIMMSVIEHSVFLLVFFDFVLSVRER